MKPKVKMRGTGFEDFRMKFIPWETVGENPSYKFNMRGTGFEPA